MKLVEVDKKANEVRLFNERIGPPVEPCNTGRGVRESTPTWPCGEDNQQDKKTLIFIYGETPRCYVDGCSITANPE